MSEDSMTAQITEQLPDLPKEWIWANVGQLYDVIGGGTPSTKVSEYWQGDIPWITSADIHGLKDIRPRKRTNEEGIRNSATNLVPAGSLIVVTRVSLGRIALTNTPISFSQDSQALLGNNDLIYPDYALYFLSQAVQVFKYRHRGTTIAGVTKKQLRELPFALPPISEQHRIVDKIEELFTKLDAGIESLKKAQAQLKQYRQSVLKTAVEGKLTEEWRAAHKDELEPASVLLERIQKERREKWEAEQLESFAAKGKTPKDDKWKGKYKEPPPDTEERPELPDGWTWTTVEQLGAAGEQAVLTGPFGSNLGRSDFLPAGIPVLTIGCLTNQGLDMGKAVYISENKAIELERYKVRSGDLLFSRMATVGRAGTVTAQYEGVIINYHLMRLRLADRAILPRYFISFVRGSQIVKDYVREVNHGATRDGINTRELLNMPIAIPPFMEQQEIAEEIERCLSVADEVESTISTELNRVERLRQSILKRAFSGKLVPQDQNDEPASILLERIKAEKAVREAENKRARKSKAKPKK